MLGTTVLFLLT